MKSWRRSELRYFVMLFIVGCLGIPWLGCDTKKPEPVVEKADESARPPLRVLFVGPQDISSSVARRWSGVSSQELDCKTISIEDFLGLERLSADVVVFPSRLVAEAAERNWIRPIGSKFLEELDAMESGSTPGFSAWPKHWKRNITYAKRVWGIPLGVGVPLTFRASSAESSNDASDGATDGKKGQEGLSLTLEQLEADSPTSASAGTLEKLVGELEGDPLAADALLDRVLSIVASKSIVSANTSLVFQSLDMKPRLGEQSWRTAIEMIVEQAKRGQVQWFQDHGRALESLSLQGKGWGMAVPSLRATAPSESGSTAPEGALNKHPLAVVRLVTEVDRTKVNSTARNGGGEWLANGVESGLGWVAAMSAETRQSSATQYFLKWIGMSDQRNAFASETSLLVPFPSELSSLTAARPEWASWVRPMAESWQDDAIVLEFRIRGGEEYRSALRRCLVKILKQPEKIEALLAECSQEWESITERLGRSNQRQSLERSLQLLEM